MDAKKLLTYCLEKLVDKPENLAINQTIEEGKNVFYITVHESDRARVIGREGKTFKALRALINVTLENNPNDIVIETAK